MHDDGLNMTVWKLNNYHETAHLQFVAVLSQLWILYIANVVVFFYDKSFEIIETIGSDHSIL